MQMRHGFAGVRAVVEHEAEAAALQTQFLRHLARFQQQMTERGLVFHGGFGKARDGLLRNEEDMGGRLRVDVPERDDQVIFIDDLRWNLACDDFLEEGLAHGL